MVSISNCHIIRHRDGGGGVWCLSPTVTLLDIEMGDGGVWFPSPTVTLLDIEMGVGVWFLSPTVT